MTNLTTNTTLAPQVPNHGFASTWVTLGDQQTQMAFTALAWTVPASSGVPGKGPGESPAGPAGRGMGGSIGESTPGGLCPYCRGSSFHVKLSRLANLESHEGICRECGTHFRKLSG